MRRGRRKRWDCPAFPPLFISALLADGRQGIHFHLELPSGSGFPWNSAILRVGVLMQLVVVDASPTPWSSSGTGRLCFELTGARLTAPGVFPASSKGRVLALDAVIPTCVSCLYAASCQYNINPLSCAASSTLQPPTRGAAVKHGNGRLGRLTNTRRAVFAHGHGAAARREIPI
jgi:hypothetical protein